MIDKMSKDDCVGCGLCASVCDRQAITMQPDECTGFFYPFIDASKCTECKKCQISCPVVVKRKSCKLKTQRTNSPKCFAVRSLNDETRFASTSGGFFTEIATEILDNGGKVYGVGYSDGMDVLHMRIDNTADLKVLQKSKYVQSDKPNIA